ncbi:MAG: ABC transporter permease [bacterium]|nr:ABC transporter permease [bacterium]
MTRFFAYVEEALASIWRNRVRSALTMLGMIIGSSSIIAVFGISKAATSGIAASFSSFGQQPAVIFADPSQLYPSVAQIHYRDITTVREALGDRARAVLPQWNTNLTVSAGGVTAHVNATQDGSYHADGLKMAEGHKFTVDEVDGAQRVAVITHDLATKFFGDASALGREIRVGGTRFTVIGVYGDISGSLFNSLAGSSTVLVPYTTYHIALAHDRPPDFLMVYPTDPLADEAVGNAAVKVLQHIHGSRAQYRVQDAAAQVQAFTNVLGIVGTGLSAIGGVALVVAGIGIMNIMLVSVTERTREIGIRKSIGASRRDIVAQFLIEAVLLSLGGGLTGMLFGILATVGAANLLSKQLGTLLIPYLLIVSIALVFSLLVGTVFGSYPAVRASQMDPIEALRS